MKKFDKLVKIVAKLRHECPWDKVQTFESLKPFLIEEVHEAIGAIDDKDWDGLAEEAGDMLLHVVMLAVMLKEKSNHSISSIIDGITKKMVRRHPHVFLPAGRHGGQGKAATPGEVLKLWAEMKSLEK